MKKIYWKLSTGKIAVTTIIEEEVAVEKLRPDSSAILIDEKYLKVLPSGNVDTWKFIEGKGLVTDIESVEGEKWKSIRALRDAKLAQSDTYVIRTVESGGDLEPLKVYRQALRDITNQLDIENIEWPTLPYIQF